MTQHLSSFMLLYEYKGLRITTAPLCYAMFSWYLLFSCCSFCCIVAIHSTADSNEFPRCPTFSGVTDHLIRLFTYLLLKYQLTAAGSTPVTSKSNSAVRQLVREVALGSANIRHPLLHSGTTRQRSGGAKSLSHRPDCHWL